MSKYFRGNFRKYLSKEDVLQGACIGWLKMQHKNVLFCHPHNEGKRSSFERYRAVVVGLKDSEGVLDLLIFEPRDVYNGLAVEFKTEGGRLSVGQRKWIAALEERGWRCEVCHNIDEFKKTVDTYLSL